MTTIPKLRAELNQARAECEILKAELENRPGFRAARLRRRLDVIHTKLVTRLDQVAKKELELRTALYGPGH